MLTFVAFLTIAAVTWYVLDPHERREVLRRARPAVRLAHDVIGQARKDPAPEPLRQRTPLPVVTFGLLALNAAIMLSMALAPGTMGDSDNLLRWGASTGPRTTNGEWTRLLTAMFVHTGLLHLLVNAAALAKLGIVTERLAGPLGFATSFLASGLVASAVALDEDPLAIAAGASGAIAGILGLLVANLAWIRLRPGTMRLPLTTLHPLTGVLTVFGLYNLVSGALPLEAELAGFATGLGIGVVAATGASERTIPARHVALPAAAALVLAAGIGFPLRGITDAAPEIARVVEIEARLAEAYAKAVGQFRLGAISAPQLARLIERSIVPEIAEAETRMRALDRVPPAQRSMLEAAREYLKLRHESWLLRRDALAKSNMVALRAAEQKERESLRAFERLRPTGAS